MPAGDPPRAPSPIEWILERRSPGWKTETTEPAPLHLARADLVAIMATILSFAPEAGTLSPEALVDWADEIYSESQRKQPA